MSDFDTQKYLDLVGLGGKVKLGAAPTLELLKLLVNYQVTHVVYQNLDLLVTRDEVDLTPPALLERLLVENRGGVCYELCELMLKVLLEFKFDARRVATHCVGAFEPSGPIDNHPVIVVHLKGKTYHVDVGYGYGSFREPLEFSYEETQERSCLPFEKYRLECFKNHYVLQMWVKTAWADLYRFERPLIYLDDDLSMKKYRECIYFPGQLPVRDSLFKAGHVTESGRIGFSCDFEPKAQRGRPPYKKSWIDNSDEAMKSEIVEYATFRQELQKMVNITINDNHFDRT